MILTYSIAIGLVFGFFLYEWVGFLPGGLVVPGYIALYLDRPLMVISTIFISLCAFGIIQLLSRITILYSRRRFVLMILAGFIFQRFFDFFVIHTHMIHTEISTIGYIIPGLIANELDRQGVVATLSSLALLSMMVRLAIIAMGFVRI